MHNILLDYYRASALPKAILPSKDQLNGSGFFRFGQELICYGQCATGVASEVCDSAAFDASHSVAIVDSAIQLPFDIGEVIESLRRERYVEGLHSVGRPLAHTELVRKAYYFVRDYLPVRIRRYMQRAYLRGWQNLPLPHWPVDFTVDSLHEQFLRMTMVAEGLERVPFIWFWPEGATSCLILTHDVEGDAGLRFCSSLMDLVTAFGFRSSFQVVPEDRYQVPKNFADELRARGFEFNIHDLNHDGHLFEDKKEFLRRAEKINEYAKHFRARGFRSGAMYRNQDWLNALDFSYDMSVPNVAHLEPQRGGCCTVMPYFVGNLVELPLTATQDYSLFHILNDYSIDLWKRQVDLIRGRNGLISFICHPDYLIGRRGRRTFECLLAHLRATTDSHGVWAALPGEVDEWWRARQKLKLVREGAHWKIEGPCSERARLAYARLDGERVVYSVEAGSTSTAGSDSPDKD